MTAPAKRTPPRLLCVQRVQDVTPRVRRITLGGEALCGFPTDRPGGHIKAFLPRTPGAKLELPRLGPDGPIWPPVQRRPITRTYSVRAFRAATASAPAELDVDFVLHGLGGTAGRWAADAQVGDRVGIAGPGGPHPMLPAHGPALMLGDLSAQAAMAALLEHRPVGSISRAIVVVPDAAEIQDWRMPGAEVTWLVTPPREAPARALAALEALPLDPAQPPFPWVAGELGLVTAVRAHLGHRLGLHRAPDLYALPYWKARHTEEAFHEERHRIMDEVGT